uniref:Centriolar and ciliogenesis-associated protein HYLS1 C-terminal domain-containing protein n=1 Tax=Amblyomma maculatum TaxID=34609 RepID=G3MKV5_AMBMU
MFEESVYLSDDEVRSELRKQGYGEVSYSVLQHFKRDFQKRIREEINKRINVTTSTPLASSESHTSAQTNVSYVNARHLRLDSSSWLEDGTYSSCYSSPYINNQQADSCSKLDKGHPGTSKPTRKFAPASQKATKHELSSSCYSTSSCSSASEREATGATQNSSHSTDGLAPRVLHRKVLRCCNGHAYITERSTLSTDSQELADSVLESFKENSTDLYDTVTGKPRTAPLPPFKGEPIQKDLIKPPVASVHSLLKVSGTKVTWKRVPGKCDPVTRYHEYKAFWERHKAPGEKAHKQLRWNMRAQMLQRDDVLAGSWQPAIPKEPPPPRRK